MRCYSLSVISAMNTVNVTGAFRSLFCHSYNSSVLLVKMSVVQAFYPRQNCLRPSISRLLRGARGLLTNLQWRFVLTYKS